MEVGKLAEALADLSRAIALATAFWRAYQYRGIVYAMGAFFVRLGIA